jgi:predicted DNA-binding protein YlxM (UPF0122 family)
MSKNVIKDLIDNQPKGYVKTVADRLNISKVAVYKAIDKGDLNHPALKEMINLAEEHQNQLRELEQRISKIAS